MFLGSGSTTIARIATDCVKQNFNPIFLSMGAGFGMNLVSASGLKDHLWEPFQAAPFFATNIPAVQTANAAIDKYFPGVRENANLYNESDFMSWTSGVLLEDAVKAGGLTASATPSAAEVTTGLDSLKGDTLQGLAVPLTFTSGQPHNISCWFTVRVQDGVPKLVNNGQVSCEPASSS
jgi:branched-chain amino acid transport system substrate-binding protein